MFTVIEYCNVTKKAYVLTTVDTLKEARYIADNHFYPCEIIEHETDAREYVCEFGSFDVVTTYEDCAPEEARSSWYRWCYRLKYNEDDDAMPDGVGDEWEEGYTYYDEDEANEEAERLNAKLRWYRDLMEEGYAWL